MLLSGVVLIVLGIVGLVFDEPESLAKYDQVITGGAIVAISIGGVLVLIDLTERYTIAASGTLVAAGVLVSEGQLHWMSAGVRAWLIPLVIVALVLCGLVALFIICVDEGDNLIALGLCLAVIGIAAFITDAFLDLGGWDPALNVLGTLLLTAAPLPVFLELVDDQESDRVFGGGGTALAAFPLGTTATVAVAGFDLPAWAAVPLIIVAAIGFLLTVTGAWYAIRSARSGAEPQAVAAMGAEAPVSLARLRNQPDGAYRLLPRVE